MSKLNIVRRCYNCGAILQTDDKEAEGYVSPEVIKNTNALVVFCDSCYAKQRYNFSKHELACSDEYLSMLKDARASDALIVCVIDLFSFEAGFPKDVVDIISNNPVLVIANKRDLLPADADDQKLKEYVAHRFRVSKISVEANDVVLTSLTGMADISPIAKEIEKIDDSNTKENLRRIVLPVESIDYNVAFIARQLGNVNATAARNNVYLTQEGMMYASEIGADKVEGKYIEASVVNEPNANSQQGYSREPVEGSISLKVSGSIDLNGGAKMTANDIKKLIEGNQALQREIIDIITSGLNRNGNAGRNANENWYNRNKTSYGLNQMA